MVARGPVPSGNEYLMGLLRDDGDGSRDEQQYRIIGRQERKQNDVTNIEESRRGATHTERRAHIFTDNCAPIWGFWWYEIPRQNREAVCVCGIDLGVYSACFWISFEEIEGATGMKRWEIIARWAVKGEGSKWWTSSVRFLDLLQLN